MKIVVLMGSPNKKGSTAILVDHFKRGAEESGHEVEVDGNYELEHFDHFICKILATYADDSVLNEAGKIDYHTFKPVLFEFPTYEYFVTGESVGNCGKMN